MSIAICINRMTFLSIAVHRYVEYDASGRVIKGEEVKAQSRYEEDVYINNHTAVWGSFWRDGAWGYACCRSTVKQSYCVGHAGIAAEQAQARRAMQSLIYYLVSLLCSTLAWQNIIGFS